jgi:hypothetical protein
MHQASRPPLLPQGACAEAAPASCCTPSHQPAALLPPQGWSGPLCDVPFSRFCANNCTGRGACERAFCHCQPGWWGVGCTRSRVFKPHSGPPSRRALRIFMYDLPPSVAFQDGVQPGWEDHDHMYTAWWSFLQTFLDDWIVRTENPWEANLFYIPALNFYYTGAHLLLDLAITCGCSGPG